MRTTSQGYLLLMVMVFSSVFFVTAASFFGYIIGQRDVVDQKVALQRALEVAESGINYYRWYLAHYPDDATNGTGGPGPYVHVYRDPEGAAIGEFSLTITSSAYCGDVSSISVTSEGFLYENPDIKRTITAQYSRPSVAEYSYIINSNVWAGPDRQIVGPYHTNGGIRMDGRNFSTVSSGLADWSCNSSFGCAPTTIRDGVFTTTANANPALFSYPTPPIDFNGLLIDLSTMKDRAQNAGGIYIPEASSGAGYRVTFNSNGTITVRRVTGTQQYWGYTTENGWQEERHVINNEASPTTYTIPANCPLIFVEDKVWLEGVVNQKVTIAAADPADPGNNPQIILNNNITYTSASTSGLLAIAEQDVLLGLSVPDNMTLNGIFVAQNGRFGRNRYCTLFSGLSFADVNCILFYQLPLGLQPFNLRNSLTLNGTIVSNGREGTKWNNGTRYVSGFNTRTNSYDRNLVLRPPPLVPRTSDVSSVVDWQDER